MKTPVVPTRPVPPHESSELTRARVALVAVASIVAATAPRLWGGDGAVVDPAPLRVALAALCLACVAATAVARLRGAISRAATGVALASAIAWAATLDSLNGGDPLHAIASLLVVPACLVAAPSARAAVALLVAGAAAQLVGHLTARGADVPPAAFALLAGLLDGASAWARLAALRLERLVAARDRQIAEVRERLVTLSRQAGAAEVATSVLHNVGNVLTNVRISAEMIHDRTRQASHRHLRDVADLLLGHREDVGDFVTKDPRGRKIPDLLDALSARLEQENAELAVEIGSFLRSIDHASTIVSSQQEGAREGAFHEEIAVSEVIETAVMINAASFEKLGIAVVRRYEDESLHRLDRHALLQILVNVVNNAKQALRETHGRERVITLTTRHDGHRTIIEVHDNGVGIPQKNLGKIFDYGFTTKPDGFGFGLHSAASEVARLGGRISARSDGEDQGAEFTIELPLPESD
jgi:signal transduction histidine kinase